MNNKQFLRIVVTSVMALSIVSTATVPYITNSDTVYAEEIGNWTEVSTPEALTNAIPTAQSEDSTAYIKLKDNITQSITIPEGVTVTIDLNGYTLTNTSGDHTITNNGTLTIEDTSNDKTGTVDNITNQKGALYNTGTVTLNSGNFTRSKESSTNSYYVIDNGGAVPNSSAVMVINDGVNVTNTSNSSSLVRTYGTLTINGGNFENKFSTIKSEETSTLNINGGTIKSVNQSGVYCYGTVNITGDASITSENSYAIWSLSYQNYDSSTTIDGENVVINGIISVSSDGSFDSTQTTAIPNITIINGTINGDIIVGSNITYKGNTFNANSGKVTIIGGTINGNVELYTDDDFTAAYMTFNMTGGTVDSVNLGSANHDNTTITGGIFQTYPEDYITGDDTVAVGVNNGDTTTYYIAKDNTALVDLLNDNNAIGSNDTDVTVEVMKVATDNSSSPLDLTGVENIGNATISANKSITIMGEPIELFTTQPLDNSNNYEYELVSEDTNNTINISEDNKTVTGNTVGTTQIKHTEDNITIIQDVTVKAFEITNKENIIDKTITSTNESLQIETNSDGTLTYESNNSSVEVSDTGKISCSVTGTINATITVTDIYGNTDSVTVNVNIPTPPTTTTEETTVTEDTTTSAEETTVTEVTTKNKEIKVTTLDDITISNTSVEIGKEYCTVLSTKEEDSFPESIEVMVDGVILSPNQYTYVDGKLTIPSEYVTGDITITVISHSIDYDINSDEKANSLDILILKKYMLGMTTFTDEQLEVADISGDGRVNIIDFISLKNILLQP